MNLPLFSAFVRKAFFCWSAMTSKAKPNTQTHQPATSKSPGSVAHDLDVTQTSTGEATKKHHRAWIVQMPRNLSQCFLSSSNLESLPSRRIRLKRNEPSRTHQIVIMAGLTSCLISRPE